MSLIVIGRQWKYTQVKIFNNTNIEPHQTPNNVF